MAYEPYLDLSELNIVLSVLGGFIVLYGLISVLIKQKWYLGEALPAMVLGIALGPIAAAFLDNERWGSAVEGQENYITLGVARIVIGVQLVIAGYQLPAKYQLHNYKEMLICLLPVMTLMWLCTSGCIVATFPNLSYVSTLVIGACVTPTDPVLSQAIAKGPFADKFVPRALREIISSEAGANDGFGFPFLLLGVNLLRYANEVAADDYEGVELEDERLARQGGGLGVAIGDWVVVTWLYIIFMSIAYGAVIGFIGGKGIKFCLRRKWIDAESYLLFPVAIGLFTIGTSGLIGTDDLLACFIAGNALNWDGNYLEETIARHDEVNACIDTLLNLGGFMYVGIILPWSDFGNADIGLSYGRLFGLGFMVLFFRRIPAIFALYKTMPKVVTDWKEALFMGYFGPIGIGAVYYLEYALEQFPRPEEGVEEDFEVNELVRAIYPIVLWLVFFSIVVHGISIPLLDVIYRWQGVEPIQEDAMVMRRKSISQPMPINSAMNDEDPDTILAYNRFSRPVSAINAASRRPSINPADVEAARMGRSMDGTARRQSRAIRYPDDDEIARQKELAMEQYNRQHYGRGQVPSGNSSDLSDAETINDQTMAPAMR